MRKSIFRTASAVLMMSTLTLVLISPAHAQDAASLYKAKCVMCHSADGSGSSPAGKAMKVPDLRSDEVQKKTDAQLTDVLVNGKNKMPAYKDKLSGDEVKGLVGYMRALAKK